MFSLSVFFVYYHNDINPARLANIVLQNDAGQKVVFVKMSHIATPKFFEEKNASLNILEDEGFVFLAEGVGSGSVDSESKINEVMGFNFTSLGYSQIAEIFGLAEQDDSLYDGIDSEKIINVDLKIDDVVALLGSGTVDSGEVTPNIEQEMQQFSREMALLSNRQRNITRYIITSLLNFMLKMSDEQLVIIEQNKDSSVQMNFLYVVLNERNKPIVEYISSHSDQNIAVVYGALHFQGILKGLQEKDSSWKIISAQPFLPYSQ